MALLIAAVCLVLIGANVKKGHALSFFGAMACALATLNGLLSGASWQETLLYVLLTLAAASLPAAAERRRDE